MTVSDAFSPTPSPRPRRRRAKRRGSRWLDFSIAATALVVSTASLLVARHQAQVMDRQLAASVWPSVQPSYSNVGPDGAWRVVQSVTNRGVGPARVESFRVFFGDRPVRDRDELGTACCPPAASAGGARARVDVVGSYLVDRVVSPGENVDWIRIRFDSTGDAATRRETRRAYDVVARAAGRMHVRLCYCSVLDECWVASDDTRRPARVTSCDEERKHPQYD